VTPNVSGSSNSRPCDARSAMPTTSVVNSTSSQPPLTNQIVGQNRINSDTCDG
jgi:hypothetical protein